MLGSYYFWLNQYFEKENKIPEKIDFASYVGQYQINVDSHYSKGGLGGLKFENVNKIFILFSNANNVIDIRFQRGLLHGVSANVDDIDSIDNIEKWCKEKINFLKFVEIDK